PVQGGVAVLALPRSQRAGAVHHRVHPRQPDRGVRAVAVAAHRGGPHRGRPRRPRPHDAARGSAGRSGGGSCLHARRRVMGRDPDRRPLLARAHEVVGRWGASFGPFERHPSTAVDEERLSEALDRYLARLTAPPGDTGGNYPFFHPRYAGQMLKPPHPVAVAAYAAALRVNPNNHALDGGPPTGQMEKEVVAELAEMFGLPAEALGHLTGGGTIANLEALW